jgi:hydroxymethylpyrimidine/phosphomethylpyrimidine kinase
MTNQKASPRACALAIGGIDPGGGAGIVADLRAFEAAGAFGCAAVAVLTVQSTAGLREVSSVPSRRVLAQAEEVVRHQRVRAVKVGALGTSANVRAVGAWLAGLDVPAVVDTPMVPTRKAGRGGRARLLAERAVAAVRTSLIPRAALLTVNAAEAEVLLERRVARVAEAYDAARALRALGAGAALVKGGHLAGGDAVDVLALDDDDVVELRAPRLRAPPLHGLGCTFASLIAGRLAVDPRPFAKNARPALLDAVRWAKKRHHAAIAESVDVGGPLRVVTFASGRR